MARCEAFVENFADLLLWSNSGLTVSGNAVKASEGGTRGGGYRVDDYSSSVRHQGRIEFDIVYSNADGAGHYCGAGIGNSTTYGLGAGYLQGVGLCVWNTPAGAGVPASQGVALAEGSMVDGTVYHCVVSFYQSLVGGGASEGVMDWSLMVYQSAPGGLKFLGGNRYEVAGGSKLYFTQERVNVISSCANTTVRRMAFEPFMVPQSASTRGYMVGGPSSARIYVPACAESAGWTNTSPTQVGVFIPGHIRTEQPRILVALHGAGNPNPWMTMGGGASGVYPSASVRWAVVDAALQAGMIVIAPVLRNRAGAAYNNWSSPTAYGDLRDTLDLLKSLFTSLTDAKLVLYGYSMGGGMAARVIATNERTDIHGMILAEPAIGLYAAWAGSYTNDLEDAWTKTHGVWDSAAAHAALDAYDAATVIGTHPERFAALKGGIHIFHRTLDPTITPAAYSTPFVQGMDAAGVQYTLRAPTYGAAGDGTLHSYQPETSFAYEAMNNVLLTDWTYQARRGGILA